MRDWIQRNLKTIIVTAFLVPIIIVAIISISHVTLWYGITNPGTWAAYLSVGIEIAALSALAALSVKMGKRVYLPFGIVTLIQFIGNVFFSYSFIDVTTNTFKSWVDLVSPVINLIGIDPTDIAGQKRVLALLAGGMMPVISLTFLHMLIKYTEEEREKSETTPVIDANDLMSEVSRVRIPEEDLNFLETFLSKRVPVENHEVNDVEVDDKHEEYVSEVNEVEAIVPEIPEEVNQEEAVEEISPQIDEKSDEKKK
jgi:hypothetical protein